MNKQGIFLLALLSLCFTCFAYSQTRAEYWIDTDPGRGKATTFYVSADASVDIPTSSLTYGWHIAGIRVQQSKWSQTYTHRFYKAAPKAEPGVLSGMEYWLDTDPGQGQATTLPFTAGQMDFAMDFATEGLEPGFHTAGLRVRYGAAWSQTYTHRFFIAAPAPAATELTAAEYWVDTDPGQGKALPLAVAAGQSEIALDVLQIDTLPEGYHVVGIRVRYGELWSQTYTHRFLHTVKQVIDTHIEAVEAYWDDHTEQVIAIPFVQQGDSAVIESYDFDTKDLTYGKHYLYLYAKANGVKSVVTRYEICKTATPQLSFADVYYTEDEAFSLSDLATPTGGTFYINDVETTLFDPKANEPGTYHVRYVVPSTDGCTAVAETSFILRVKGDETALDETKAPSSAIKVLRNDQILILRVEKVYTVTGQEIK